MSLGRLIRDRRKAKRLSQARLADLVGVSRAAIGQWEADETAPSRRHAPDLARALELELGAISPLLAPSVIDSTTIRSSVPLMGMDAFVAGEAAPSTAERVSVGPGMPADAVALTVMDASMSPEFSPGDLVIVSRTQKPLAQDVVIALLDGGALMRTYVPRGNDSTGNPVFDLLSTSADYPTVTCNSANGGKVLGVVVSHWRTRIR